MTNCTLFTNGVLNNRRVDILCNDGVIKRITPSTSSDTINQGCEVHDLEGRLVVPSLAEPHAHLDKAFLADRVQNTTGDLMGAIVGLESVRHTITLDDIVERSCQAARLMSRNGVTSIRTHVDTTIAGGLTGVHALLKTKELCSSFIDIQVAMLLEWPITGDDATPRLNLAQQAIDAGVDVIGGCPHLDPRPREAVETLLDLAVRYRLPLDLHADENLRTTSTDLEHVAALINQREISHHVNASHCVALSTRPTREIEEISRLVAEANISVTALPQTNLFLQSREIHTLAPRAITPTAMLREAGVIVAAGADNLQDPFNPVGRADPLETASIMVVAAHETPEEAFRMVSTNAHRVINGTPHDITVGVKADFVAITATNLREVVAMGPPDRTVVYGGVVITEQKRNIK